MKIKTIARFPLGTILVTPAALAAIHPEDLSNGFARHAKGDWGDCGEEDWNANQEALKHELRLFSVYHDRNQNKFWIITEASRIATTALLPEDY